MEQQPLKRDQNVAPNQEEAYQKHWCVDTDLGSEMLDAILLDLHQDGKLNREEYKNLHSKPEDIDYVD